MAFFVLFNGHQGGGAVKEDNTIQQPAEQKKKRVSIVLMHRLASNQIRFNWINGRWEGGGCSFSSSFPPLVPIDRISSQPSITRTWNFFSTKHPSTGVSNGGIRTSRQIVFFFCLGPGKRNSSVFLCCTFSGQMTVQRMEVIRHEPPAIWAPLSHTNYFH
jgi:hypothetical protein